MTALFRTPSTSTSARARTSPSPSWRDSSATSVGFKGEIVRDPSKPDGTPRKLMSGDKLRALGWRPRIGLREGLADAYAAFLEQDALV